MVVEPAHRQRFRCALLCPIPDHVLLPGAFVSLLRHPCGQREGAFLVPQAGIQRDAHGAYALVVGKDGNVVRRSASPPTAAQAPAG